MSSEFGNKVKVTLFGQSHGEAVGVVVDGLPAGERIDMSALQAFLDRRKPGKPLCSGRTEPDAPRFVSGLVDNVTCASPLCAVIDNTNARPCDYDAVADTPRPSHADYTAFVKWQGNADMRGGGHFSGRLTAPLCVAGGIAMQILARKGVSVGAHLYELGGMTADDVITDDALPLKPTRALFEQLNDKVFPTISDERGQSMANAISAAASAGDSLGGIIECAAVGLEPGLGSPIFGGVENRLSAALFGIPAVKGVEFGSGFAGALSTGSRNNDEFAINEEGRVVTLTNNCGGVLGGLTDGMPLVLRVAVKPTPSIAMEQQTVSLSRREETALCISGRHDPCIALRAVPVVEAVTALVLLDMLEEG